MEFVSASPPAVKSIKQRELLNYWLRLYAKHERLPRFDDYRPERLAEERDDLVYIIVEGSDAAPRFFIESDGDRMSIAFGSVGKGRDLEEYLGVKLAPTVMPIYQECVWRQLPMYTISQVNDLYGRKVDYETARRPGLGMPGDHPDGPCAHRGGRQPGAGGRAPRHFTLM